VILNCLIHQPGKLGASFLLPPMKAGKTSRLVRRLIKPNGTILSLGARPLNFAVTTLAKGAWSWLKVSSRPVSGRTRPLGKTSI